MKTVTSYIAEDGTRFDDMAECLDYEALCRMVDFEVAKLHPAAPTGFGTFVQQETLAVLNLQSFLVTQLRNIAGSLIASGIVDEVLRASYPIGFTIIGRFVSDAAPACVRRAWFRIQCMDNKFREWGAPYLAIESNKRDAHS